MKKFFVLLTIAALFVACGDESSSSAPASDPSEESSSSIEKTNESSSSATVKNSSSSVSGDKSSSSVKKEDSSSSAVKSSSSVTPKSSSSEEVKRSSSSIVALSSSVVEPSSSSSFDKEFNGSLWRAGAYKAFVDPRDNREYYYIQITGKDTAGKAATIKVMAENLNVGEFVWGFEDQEDDSKIERYCYKNDTANCNKYGGLYQWAEMMQLPSRCNTESCADLIKPNHQGICPSGWRLLTYNDYYIVVHADNNEDGVKGTRAGCFGGSDDTGYSLVGTGIRTTEGGFDDFAEATFWYYPVEQSSNPLRASCNGMSRSQTTISLGYQTKISGTSVRCVMVE
ncbi:FISUMP domain-containing protein [Fibrobacter sp. UWB10]|uniref:FISUMP domain-containing protein n=1 Tax=Fibrobacter sp. UWB10 TaxID=1896201 RepID=UPI002403839A|nr:FISUMP domain-containing protein [Fibrobacter sp. UWB10]SMP41577.1 major paralogous domain-containing protein [Fibrobacter sp. UWB10]